jgi:hypothetical protein
MKRNILVFSVLIALTGIMYSSCSKIAALIRAQAISFTATDLSFNVPVITSTTANTSIGSGTFTYNIDSLIRAQTVNQFGLANIDTVTLTSCTLTIQNPDADNNFANFESASGSFSTSADANVANMGSITNNPDTYAATLSVPVNSGVNLKSYVSPSGLTSFSYSVMGQARRATTKPLTVTMHVTYNIHVSL